MVSTILLLLRVNSFSEYPFFWDKVNSAVCFLETAVATIILFSKMNALQPTKSEWLNQKIKKNLFFISPLISFQDLKCDIFNNDFGPSEGHSIPFLF